MSPFGKFNIAMDNDQFEWVIFLYYTLAIFRRKLLYCWRDPEGNYHFLEVGFYQSRNMWVVRPKFGVAIHCKEHDLLHTI